MEEYQFSQGKNLRCGYTTGSCATAAAKAAAAMLLTGMPVDIVRITTPKGIILDLEPLEAEVTDAYASCAIRKDSGDDPDDTHGILVYAKVEKSAESGIVIAGGIGVGMVTRPGLACAVGGPAINPTPRRMITAELEQVIADHGYTGGLKVTISIPAGVEIAKKTFNPRLGIVGGLSVLGTSGIVEPMSERALIETMYVELRAQKARGNKDLLVFFGNYGEDYTRDVLKLDLEGAVTCSNFVGELLDYAVFCGFETLLLIGHSGKLVKLAQGVMNTHSKYADCRTELFALEAMLQGASVQVGQEIYGCLTTDEVTKILQREDLFEPVIDKVTDKIDFYMQHRVHGKIKTAALMFSNVYGILGKTRHADELIKLHKRKGDLNSMRGKLYSVGIGPGDPELMTLKSVRLLKECDVVALPKGDTDVMTAKNIVSQIVNLEEKEQIVIYMPMTKDMAAMDKAHREGADAIEKLLDEGKNVVFITLGCPTVYATCIYVHKLVLNDGYDAELVAGVTSICAVAARLNTSLCERAEPLIVLPGSYKESSKFLDGPGNKVLMKSASEIGRVRDELREKGLIKNSGMVERCGLPGEKVYRDLEEIDPASSYFSVILVKEKEFDK